MSIKYLEQQKRFILSTDKSEYVFEVAPTGELRHVHYGAKKREYITETPPIVAFVPYREPHGPEWSSDTVLHEFSVFGNGDYRAEAARIGGADGTGVSCFEYESYRITDSKPASCGLPMARANEDTQTLEVSLRDAYLGCRIVLCYTLYPREDVITRYWYLENEGNTPVKIEKCMSLCVDFDRNDMDVLSLWGKYVEELTGYERFPLHHGTQSFCSRRGCSSHHRNPFFALCDRHADEDAGEVYGFNLIYSGSFLNEIDVDGQGNARVLSGLGAESFNYTVDAGARFMTPEAIMTYSNEGIGGMTRNFHAFIRRFILPECSMRPHPVVLNTWEACYFKINEDTLVDFAAESARLGFDMLVMDDGWFGARNNDRAGLGDWFVNREKFPDGLGAFVKRVKEKGVKFGIWIEPEMVNPDSELYRAHPEWSLHIDGRDPLYGRHQLVLDMSNPQVTEYLKDSFSKVFDGIEIDYIKWDMNRNLTDICSPTLPRERQGEVAFRYMLGVYSLLEWFAHKFPNTLIETCSGGGGRYDLGMMCYGMQIWTSDNTKPHFRTMIQNSSLTAYPANTMSCHVSNPHDSLVSLDYRYKVAVGGMLGYELNILKMSDEIKAAIAKQIADYRIFEHLMRLGEYHRLASPTDMPYAAYYYISESADEVLLTVIEKANGAPGETVPLKVKSAKCGCVYTDVFSGRTYTGEQLRDGICLPLDGTDEHAELMYLRSDG